MITAGDEADGYMSPGRPHHPHVYHWSLTALSIYDCLIHISFLKTHLSILYTKDIPETGVALS